MNLNRLIQIAFALKGKSYCGGRSWHVSFILKKSKILSIGINNYNKTHPKLKKFNYHSFSGLHSEMSAVIKLGHDDCSNLNLVNIRIDNNNKLALSRPCKFCRENFLPSLNFNDILYTDEHGKFVNM